MKIKIKIFALLFTASILFVSCDDSLADAAYVPVTGITLNHSERSIVLGATPTAAINNLTATIAPANATNRTVRWTSSNPSVVAFNALGYLPSPPNPPNTLNAPVGTVNTVVSVYPTAPSPPGPGVATVTVHARAVGTATITVSVTTGGVTHTATATVTVTPAPVIPVTGVTLNHDALSFVYGQSSTQTLAATVAPANATNRAVTWASSETSVATVNATGVVTAVGAGTATITVTTTDGGKTADATVTVSELSTALGGVVINGITWATRNVDALGTFADYPEDAGLFFQWNRPAAWAATGAVTGWDSTVPEGTEWESANNPCPTGWRVPTQQELQSLNSAGSVWITFNEVNGRVFGTAPNQIFLPAAGARSAAGALGNVGTLGNYWSSTPFATTTATSLLFDSAGSSSDMNPGNRTQGFSVRCVAE